MPWWADPYPRIRFFRPLSSLSLWLDFAPGLPPWWMHLENCAIYAVIAWLAVALYRQLGLSGAGLGWSALFFGLDGALAMSVGWLAARNTLLAACFGLACILVHDRARRAGRPTLLTLSLLCFTLSLLSAEFGLCTLGYLSAHALAIDRASVMRRLTALLPYGVVTGVYLAHYLGAGYGAGASGLYRDAAGSPILAMLAWLESIPIWLATTATVPIASLRIFVPDFGFVLLGFSLVVLAIVLPILGLRWTREPHGRMLAIGAALSLLPLAAVLPQERLRFFVAFGVYGVLGPWVVRDIDAPGRVRRVVTRFVWRMHGVWLPLLFAPLLFSVRASIVSAPVRALDQALSPVAAPTAIVINPPAWSVPWFQAALRQSRGEPGPAVYALYAGGQPLDAQRVDDRSLELHVARSWFSTPFEAHLSTTAPNLLRPPFYTGRARSRRCATSKYTEYAFGHAPCARTRRAQKSDHIKLGAVVLETSPARRFALAIGSRSRTSTCRFVRWTPWAPQRGHGSRSSVRWTTPRWHFCAGTAGKWRAGHHRPWAPACSSPRRRRSEPTSVHRRTTILLTAGGAG